MIEIKGRGKGGDGENVWVGGWGGGGEGGNCGSIDRLNR